ncbi:MFS transporter [Parapedobacter sp. 2B3]|uniref:MFS transporter n=1 Tax=Parapedobacter sp. 2B3 TaxID=3342381 RepID=UPI0035B66C76
MAKHGNIRWTVALMLFFASALNYLDRQVLSVLAPTIQAELGLDDVDYAFITSSFLLSYTVMYAVSGVLVDRLGTRKSFLWAVSGWSIANILHAFAKTAMQFSAFRFLLGIAESANFPAGVKAASEWFPLRERALAIGMLNAGSSAGAAIAIPLVSVIAIQFNWQAAFVVTGLLGFIWLFFWQRHYYLPQDHPRVSQAERGLILEDQLPDDEQPKRKVGLLRLLRMRQAWGCLCARIFIDPITYFLIFWIPKYLQEQQGLSLDQMGYFAWIPFVVLAVGTLLGGIIPRWLINRAGWSLNRARKTVMLAASLLIPACCAALFNAGNAAMALLAIAGIMLGHGLWGNITIPAEVFPKQVQGTLTGIGGTLGGIAGILSQLSVGWTVLHFSYVPIFIAIGAAYLFTFLCVHVMTGKLGHLVSLED